MELYLLESYETMEGSCEIRTSTAVIGETSLMIFGDNELRVRLGYPGIIEGSEIPDHRNDRRIMNPFRQDGKLIE